MDGEDAESGEGAEEDKSYLKAKVTGGDSESGEGESTLRSEPCLEAEADEANKAGAF